MINETKRLEVTEEYISFDGKFIQVISRKFRNKITGDCGVWECIKRKTFGRIVAVLPITNEGNLILIRIFRIPLNSWIIEPVAGLMDAGNEEEVDLAKREMVEEVGYDSTEIEHLCSGPFNAGLNGDEISFYVGLNAKRVSEPSLEYSEDIEVLEVPLQSASDFLLNHGFPETLVDVKLFGLVSIVQNRFKEYM